MARYLCHFLLGPGFHLALPHRHINCLPAVNQGRSKEISQMAWYIYDIEFRRRASYNLSLNWGNGMSNNI